MRRTALRFVLACILSLACAFPAGAKGLRIWVVTTENAGPHVEASSALQASLAGEAEIVVGSWNELARSEPRIPDLIVTVGVAALDAALEQLTGRAGAWTRTPVLSILIPRRVFDTRRESAGVGQRSFSAVVLDQPLERQLRLIRRALPAVRRIGIVPGEQTLKLRPVVQQEMHAQGFQPVFGQPVATPGEIYPSLREVLDQADIVLALPDPDVFNATTLQHILLSAYRARKPVAAFAPAYVKAGAILAVHATPAQAASRASEIIHGWKIGTELPKPQATREFTVTVNAKVAESLGLQMDDADAIAGDLQRQERRP